MNLSYKLEFCKENVRFNINVRNFEFTTKRDSIEKLHQKH